MLKAKIDNFFWIVSTFLLAPFFYTLIFLRKRNSRNKPSVLVISTNKIGDMVCMTPVFREIKKNYPSCRLTAIVNPLSEDILKNNPRIDEIISMKDYPGIARKLGLLNKLRKSNYDFGLVLTPTEAFFNIITFWSLIPLRMTTTHRPLGRTHRLLSHFSNRRLEYQRHTLILRHFLELLRFIGIEDCSEDKELFTTKEEDQKSLDFLKSHNLNEGDLIVGISVTAGVKLKEWQEEKFAELSDMLIEKKRAKIVFIGSAEDRDRVERVRKMMHNDSISSAGLFNLSELPALLKRMKLFIAVDCGPLYMADAVGTPVIDIVGPHDIKEQAPSGPKHKIIQKNLPCAPCSFIFIGSRVCKGENLRCLTEVTPQEVFEAAKEII